MSIFVTELPPIEALLIGFVVTTIASTVQGSVGMGFALVSVPVLSLVHPALAPEPQILMVFPLLCFMVWRERKGVQLSGIGWILLGRVPGAALGLLLLKLFVGWALDVLLALVVLSGVLILMLADRVAKQTPRWQFGAGVLSSIMSLVSSIGGPPIALLYRNDPGPIVRSNLSVVFAVGSVMTIGTRLLGDELSLGDLQVAACLFPAVVIGFLISRKTATLLDGKGLRPWILGLSSLACVGLIVRAALH